PTLFRSQGHEAIGEEADVVPLARQELLLLTRRAEQVGHVAVLEEGVLQQELHGLLSVGPQTLAVDVEQAAVDHTGCVRGRPGPAGLRPDELIVAYALAGDVVDAVEDAAVLLVERALEPEREDDALEVFAVELGQRWTGGRSEDRVEAHEPIIGLRGPLALGGHA